LADVPLADLARSADEAWAAELIGSGHGRRGRDRNADAPGHAHGALDAGMIDTNPAARVRLPPAPPTERTPADRVLDREAQLGSSRRPGT
jgi:hypothetical protein